MERKEYCSARKVLRNSMPRDKTGCTVGMERDRLGKDGQEDARNFEHKKGSCLVGGRDLNSNVISNIFVVYIR